VDGSDFKSIDDFTLYGIAWKLTRDLTAGFEISL
jgi:hypothetical protein